MCESHVNLIQLHAHLMQGCSQFYECNDPAKPACSLSSDVRNPTVYWGLCMSVWSVPLTADPGLMHVTDIDTRPSPVSAWNLRLVPPTTRPASRSTSARSALGLDATRSDAETSSVTRCSHNCDKNTAPPKGCAKGCQSPQRPFDPLSSTLLESDAFDSPH